MDEIDWRPAVNVRPESEARKLECRFPFHPQQRYLTSQDGVSVTPLPARPISTACSGSACAHWLWADGGGTRYIEEKMVGMATYTGRGDGLVPAEMPDDLQFVGWNGVPKDDARCSFTARRAVEIIVPRGRCGLINMGGE